MKSIAATVLLLPSVLGLPQGQMGVACGIKRGFPEPAPTCPFELPYGAVEAKSMVPISRNNPSTRYGYRQPTITPNDFCTIFNFDLPAGAAGKTCSVLLLFPDSLEDPRTQYTYQGQGHFTFTEYADNASANEGTTYNDQPAMGPSGPISPPVVSPGKGYTIAKVACGQGQTLSGRFCSSDTTFNFEETDGKGDRNAACPMGLFVAVS